MIEFVDPFEALLLVFAEQHPDRSVCVQFGMPDAEPLCLFPGAKGITVFPSPEEDALPVITVDATLDRGVQGSIDILAHELAHVAGGEDHEHDEVWQSAYDGLFAGFCEKPGVPRQVRG